MPFSWLMTTSFIIYIYIYIYISNYSLIIYYFPYPKYLAYFSTSFLSLSFLLIYSLSYFTHFNIYIYIHIFHFGYILPYLLLIYSLYQNIGYLLTPSIYWASTYIYIYIYTGLFGSFYPSLSFSCFVIHILPVSHPPLY